MGKSSRNFYVNLECINPESKGKGLPLWINLWTVWKTLLIPGQKTFHSPAEALVFPMHTGMHKRKHPGLQAKLCRHSCLKISCRICSEKLGSGFPAAISPGGKTRFLEIFLYKSNKLFSPYDFGSKGNTVCTKTNTEEQHAG